MAALRVLDQGPHHLVVDKPADMVVVAGRGVPRPTVLDLAKEAFGAGVRPVHRLDRVTTGALALARSPFGQSALSDAFRRRLVDKRYLALIEGRPPWDRLDVDARLLRVDAPDARKGPLAWQTVDDAGQRALTRIRVLARGEGMALVVAQPETGRMHQIRAHLGHVGHPVAGDALYGAETALGPHRIALHAFLLSLPLPGGGRCFVAAPVPEDLKKLGAAAGIDVAGAAAPVAARFRDKAKKPAPKKPAPKGAGRSGTGTGSRRGGKGRKGPRRRR